MANANTPGPVEAAIQRKLNDLFKPTTLTIVNDSSKHRHHSAMREQGGGNGETHFSVLIVSNEFKGKRPIKRHRMVYAALTEEFGAGLHALSLQTVTPDDFDKMDKKTEEE